MLLISIVRDIVRKLRCGLGVLRGDRGFLRRREGFRGVGGEASWLQDRGFLAALLYHCYGLFKLHRFNGDLVELIMLCEIQAMT